MSVVVAGNAPVVDSDSDDDVETWALELEEELLTSDHTINSSNNIFSSIQPSAPSVSTTSSDSTAETAAILPVEEAEEDPPAAPSPLANELPHEVLVNIVGFTAVGRVSKSWSLASSTLARRKYAARLTETLLTFTHDAASVAHEVEAALFTAYGQSLSLPKSYAQKARQLLFNLKDARNAALRERLFSGELLASALVRMSARDMANPQLVQQRQQWIKKRTHEVMRDERHDAIDGFTQTDLFECRSCGSERTSYRQWRRKAIVDRTRVIVVCRDCPHRWEL